MLDVLAGLVGVAGDVRDAVGETLVRLGQVLVGSGQERDEGGGVVGAERLVQPVEAGLGRWVEVS